MGTLTPATKKAPTGSHEKPQACQGAGWLLLDAGEKWAKKKGCTGMSVGSNVLRERAHGFYLRHGYETYNTQKAFRKKL